MAGLNGLNRKIKTKPKIFCTSKSCPRDSAEDRTVNEKKCNKCKDAKHYEVKV